MILCNQVTIARIRNRTSQLTLWAGNGCQGSGDRDLSPQWARHAPDRTPSSVSQGCTNIATLCVIHQKGEKALRWCLRKTRLLSLVFLAIIIFSSQPDWKKKKIGDLKIYVGLGELWQSRREGEGGRKPGVLVFVFLKSPWRFILALRQVIEA